MGTGGDGRVRIGVAGTSWWADAMYLPAITTHPLADVRGIAGGSRREHTRQLAVRWGIANAYDSVEAMLDAETLDALLVLTPNKAHHATAMAAIERGIHVLCEKPLGMTAHEARELTDAAEHAGLTTMVPFTYRFMPANRYLKSLLDVGYLGQPYHLNMRYYTGFGRSGEYAWRFDVGEAGSGISGDLGSHWVYLARWLFGEIEAVTAVFSRLVPRGPRPDGAPYEVAEDNALMLLEFANGATGSLHMTSLAHEPGPFGQRHEIDLHGSGGTLRAISDWRTIQRVEGCRADETDPHELPIPEEIWAGARLDTVHNTYRDVFRTQEHMQRRFISAVAAGERVSPDFGDGLAVQRVLDAGGTSAREGRRVRITEVVEAGG
jgi:predicted dehydrogenase